MNEPEDIHSLSVDEAILLLALYRFARSRAQHGELLTVLAANRIAAMARMVRINAARMPSELGLRAGDVWWTTEVLRRAAGIVECAGRRRSLARLNALLEGLRVADIERYDEAEEAEPTAPEDTGVYAISRPPGVA